MGQSTSTRCSLLSQVGTPLPGEYAKLLLLVEDIGAVIPICSCQALVHCLPIAVTPVGMQVCVPGLEERARKFQPLAVESSLSPGKTAPPGISKTAETATSRRPALIAHQLCWHKRGAVVHSACLPACSSPQRK